MGNTGETCEGTVQDCFDTLSAAHTCKESPSSRVQEGKRECPKWSRQVVIQVDFAENFTTKPRRKYSLCIGPTTKSLVLQFVPGRRAASILWFSCPITFSTTSMPSIYLSRRYHSGLAVRWNTSTKSSFSLLVLQVSSSSAFCSAVWLSWKDQSYRISSLPVMGKGLWMALVEQQRGSLSWVAKLKLQTSQQFAEVGGSKCPNINVLHVHTWE